MTISDAQFSAWLKDQSAVRCVLVEADVKLAGGGVVTRYLSNKTFVTGAGDTPANTNYSPRIVGGIKFTRSLSLDGQASLSFGDIELVNTDGTLDTWIDDYWVNRQIRIYVGDVSWPRGDFRLFFSGVMTGIDCRKRDRVNIKLSDILQRLNTPLTEDKIPLVGARNDTLYPICFGEVHNITPVLVDATTNEYIVHNGAIEGVIEVRDNGVPVAFTQTPATGKFKLSAAAAGTITCSVQGAKLSANIIDFASDYTNTSVWSRLNLQNIVTAGAPTPFNPEAAVAGVISNTTSGYHIASRSFAVGANTTYTFTVYVKRGASSASATALNVALIGTPQPKIVRVMLDYLTGNSTVFVSNLTEQGGTLISAGSAPMSNGWYRLWVTVFTGPSVTNSVTNIWACQNTSTPQWSGDGVTVDYWFGGWTVEAASYALSYESSAMATSAPVYRNNIADIIRHIAMNYGLAQNRLTDLDFDLGSVVQFSCGNTQPVGFYASDRQNVLDVCNQLAASVGGRLYVTAAGKVGLVKLSLPQSSPGTAVNSSLMLDRTLEIKELAPVVAAVKIGYGKNWTVQSGLTTGLVPEAKEMYAEEWLTQTAKDSTAAANYNLFTDPNQIDTYLLTGADALAEAQRRLNMFSTQRRVFKYTGLYSLLFEQLGAPQTLTHPRFGLASGKTGQIVSIAVDLLSPHVDFEVLV